MPAHDDLDLLIKVSHAAADIANRYWRSDQKIVEKPDNGGPVSDGDLAVDTYLRETLCAARPEYGWLSEETPDSAVRLDRDRVFIVDPIDGTRNYINGETTWAHSIALADKGRITAAVVYLPQRDKLYTATLGGGARLNGQPIAGSGCARIAGATVLAQKSNLDAHHWIDGSPPLKRHFRPSLAYRLCLVAEGRFDAMLTLRDSWEWDIAAGALICAEAGNRVTDRTGAPLVFNATGRKTSGVLCASPVLHDALQPRLA